MTKQRRLGRGLAALLNEPQGQWTDTTEAEDNAAPDQKPAYIPLDTSSPENIESNTEKTEQDSELGIFRLNVYSIDDNPYQPRREFSDSEISSLSESLKEHDLLQPVLVRRCGDRYQLISGERRLRAAIQAGWSEIPAQVREADDRLVAELAIVENLQRKDLNAIEKALSFQRYIQEHSCTQEDLASRIKVDRSTIANLLRLLELPQEVKDSLSTGAISAGHARALLPLGDEPSQIEFVKTIQSEGLSVRATERLVQEKIDTEDAEPLNVVSEKSITKRRTKSNQIASLEQELRISLGTKVDVREGSRGRGRIVVHFTSHEEFERIRQSLTNRHVVDHDSQAG